MWDTGIHCACVLWAIAPRYGWAYARAVYIDYFIELSVLISEQRLPKRDRLGPQRTFRRIFTAL